MSTRPNLDEIAKAVRRLLPSGEYSVVLFGSRAQGKAYAGSDWDIGIVGPVPLDGAIRQAIRDALDELPTLHVFDLVDLQLTPEQFRKKAMEGAVRLQ